MRVEIEKKLHEKGEMNFIFFFLKFLLTYDIINASNIYLNDKDCQRIFT